MSDTAKLPFITVQIERPEGYEDVSDELVAIDAMADAEQKAWRWSLVTPAQATGGVALIAAELRTQLAAKNERIAELESELAENCRLLGISGSVEARLRARWKQGVSDGS